MVIEWLEFDVPKAQQEAFIKRDEEVWTEGLKTSPGYIGKEVWSDPFQDKVILVIRWQTREDWKSVPQAKIDQLDQQMGDLKFPIAKGYEYRVRKFLH
ncbi:MAG: TIGR03792 family protein [Oscillatoriales cyanobacterium RM2_1_1]|nr:TIGR03792 family protein [Oscillatoriales cyanobacterium SM2_3_0]NJO45334.1 TIGR03792 family protein [Oscillatoriales cyanobacterium RM2_1_1]